MKNLEYQKEVRSIAEGIIEESVDDIGDGDDRREWLEERLWETIDGHRWIIYTAYNFDVLRHSSNDGYYIENFGADGIVTDGVLNTGALAFGALYADVSEVLWSLVEDAITPAATDTMRTP